jgi:uncharacterized protein DUF4234
MKQRSVAGVIILSIFTFGIYPIAWHVMTKNEMNEAGADIPTAWMLLIPFVNIYWLWKWCGGIEHITREKMTAPVAFLLHVLLPLIGMAILQDTMNQAVRRGLPGALPQARIAS